MHDCRLSSGILALAIVAILGSFNSAAAFPQEFVDPSGMLVRNVSVQHNAGTSPPRPFDFEEDRLTLPMELVQIDGYPHYPSAAAPMLQYSGPSPDDQYKIGADSMPQPGVPKGKIFQFTLDNSVVFPGTTRTITVYVPSEYSADKPACVYIGLDGLRFGATTVFDNLIFKHEMPVTIAIGIAPGTVNSADSSHNPRFNRSFEFDGLNNNLARFLLNEVLPEVEQRKTSDGLPIRLSANPSDRAVAGASTGGIGAFTLAWERPDAFRRVFTDIGTFVGMRGGDRYSVLVRKTEPKPIRIFMVDGSNDEWMGGPEVGDWWMGNQTMERALEFAGYQVNHVWGEEAHSDKHATAVFPDAMRWLWKDWPQPVVTGESQNTFLKAILQPGQDWHAAAGNYESDGAIATDPTGTLVFSDAKDRETQKLLADGQVTHEAMTSGEYSALAYGPDGRRYLSQTGNISILTSDGHSSTIADGIDAQYLIVTHDGTIYATEAGDGEDGGKVWLIHANGQKQLIDTGLNHPSGIAISPDGLWLAIAESKTHWGYSYRVQPDGSVQDKQHFYWFHVPDTADDSGAEGWVMDRDGRLYAATRMGVQVFDRNGRVRAILPLPGGRVTGLTFGGVDFDTLYVSCADHRIYSRKLKVKGIVPGALPIPLPAWSAG